MTGTAPSQARTIAALGLLMGVQLAATAHLGWRAGTHIEEIAGLLERAPERIGAGAAEAATADGQWHLRASRHLPTWGLVHGDGAFTPLMVDGHIGALPYTLHRIAAHFGGLEAARLLSWLLGAALLLGTWLLGRMVGGAAVGWLAALAVALSPQVTFMYHWAHVEEQVSAGLPVFAALALCRQRQQGGGRWLVVAGGLLGLSVAAKNTAAWTVLAMVVSAWSLDLWPRCRPRTWALALAAGALPLLPQLAYLLHSTDSEAFWQRLANLPRPEEFFAADRLAFFAEHFAVTFGALGEYIAELTGANPEPPSAWALAAGGLVGLASCALPLLCWHKAVPRPMRALGACVGLLELQYLAFYYTGMSLFGLLAPWIPLALAATVVLAWRAAEVLGRRGQPPARALLVACALYIAAIQVGQSWHMQAAYARPAHAVFDLQGQRRLVAAAMAHGATTLWTTTYDIAGVPDLLSKGRLRGRNLFATFWDVVSASEERPERYDEAWRQALDRMPPGRHLLALVPQPATIEVSPCRDGAQIARRLAGVAKERGATLRHIADVPLRTGAVGWRLVELELMAQ